MPASLVVPNYHGQYSRSLLARLRLPRAPLLAVIPEEFLGIGTGTLASHHLPVIARHVVVTGEAALIVAVAPTFTRPYARLASGARRHHAS